MRGDRAGTRALFPAFRNSPCCPFVRVVGERPRAGWPIGTQIGFSETARFRHGTSGLREKCERSRHSVHLSIGHVICQRSKEELGVFTLVTSATSCVGDVADIGGRAGAKAAGSGRPIFLTMIFLAITELDAASVAPVPSVALSFVSLITGLTGVPVPHESEIVPKPTECPRLSSCRNPDRSGTILPVQPCDNLLPCTRFDVIGTCSRTVLQSLERALTHSEAASIMGCFLRRTDGERNRNLCSKSQN
jgi:hypothetical protein